MQQACYSSTKLPELHCTAQYNVDIVLYTAPHNNNGNVDNTLILVTFTQPKTHKGN